MFRNAGGKLGLILKIMCIILMVGVLVLGILIAAEGRREEIIIGIIIALIGPVLVWIFSLYTIGMCDMMRDVYEIKRMMKNHPEFGKIYQRNYTSLMNQNNYADFDLNVSDNQNMFAYANMNGGFDNSVSETNSTGDLSCPGCGNKLNVGETFCGVCGRPVR